MNRREFVRTAGIGLAALVLPGRWTWADEDAPSRNIPNIIFILSDDVGLSEIGCCGGDHCRTPHINALTKTGTRFEYCYSIHTPRPPVSLSRR